MKLITNPEEMSPTERFSEIVAILAIGYLRLRKQRLSGITLDLFVRCVVSGTCGGAGAVFRTGVYEVVIKETGYREWRRMNVWVRNG